MLLRKLLAQQWKTFHLHRDYLAKERKERWFSPQRYEFSSLLFILIIDASEFDNPRIRVDREREHTKNFRHSMLLEIYLIALETRLLNKLDNFKKSRAKNEFSRFFRRKGKKEISALFTVRLTHSRRREEKEFRQVRNGNRLLCFRAENSRPPGLVCVFEIVKFELYHPLNSVTRTPFRRRRNNRGLISSRHYRVSAILFQPLVNSPPSFRGRKKKKT